MNPLIVLALALALQDPYVDPSQIELPFPKHSHLKQPWRAWMETRPALDFLSGIGINYNVPGNDELAVRLLAEAGIRAVRKEIGFGNVRWDESGLGDEERLRKLFALFKKYGMRPTILLNCHQGAPCPVQFFEGTLLEDAPKGATTVKLADAAKHAGGRTGLSQLSDYWAAEALILSVDAAGVCTLSKPLPKDLKAGKVPMATLKYLPLHTVGSPEFEETAKGWVRYALIAAAVCAEAGIDEFDLEIYNELTFGTKFLELRHYRPELPKPAAEFLHEGGSCWELARRTAAALHEKHPKARAIWGFSNTTFFHTPPTQLPRGIDGQSYHPYGTGTRSLPEQEYHKEQPEENADGFTPKTQVRLSEGIASTFIQTESIMRLIQPAARANKPPGVERFHHYMTEHGVLASECGVNDEPGAWALKTKCALRSYALWIHKGISVLHFYSAWYEDPKSFGLLPAGIRTLPPDARFDDVATPPLRALRALTKPFAGSVPIQTPRPLKLELSPVGTPGKIFDGKTPLWRKDVVAFLPWQTKDDEHVALVYVMTWDMTAPSPEERYRLRIQGAAGRAARLLDPVSEREVPLTVVPGSGDVLELEVPLIDTPRVLILSR